MHDRGSSDAGRPALHHGSPSRPEGESVRGHTPASRGREESPRTLAKLQRLPAAASATAPRAGGAGLPPSEEPESFEITRATCRFPLDLRALSAPLNVNKARGAKRELAPEERQAREMLEDVCRLATTARNVAMRALWRSDSQRVDDYLLQHGHMPPSARAVFTQKLYSYPVMCAAAPRLSTSTVATLQKRLDADWARWRHDVLIRQNRSPPHYRLGQPVPLPRGAFNIRFQGAERAVLDVPLYSSKHDGQRRFELPIEAKDAHGRELLQKIGSGEYRLGEAQVERDRLRPSKWYVKLTYKRKVVAAKSQVVAAINRGMRAFMVAVTSDGERWIYDADDIESYLKQIQRRRQRYQRQVRASARVGHGRTRTLQPIERLTGKAERWRKSRCQVLARRLATWLAERHVSLVYLEDFAGIRDGLPEKLEGGKYVWERIQEWPYYQLGMRLQACLEDLGIRVRVRQTAYFSQRCPRCGHVDEANKDLRWWKLRCTSCKFSAHLDVAHCLNALASGQAEDAQQLTKDAAETKSHGKAEGTARKSVRRGAKGGRSGGRGRKT